jgi:RHS repeat-associated protein
MPNRTFSADTTYRYGFNGKENDNEAKGEGNQIDFGSRIFDPRLGRFLSIDPLQKKYPNLTPYNFTGNSPIVFVDYDGEDFGIKIDHDAKTIIIVADIYTTSKITYSQAKKAADQWNSKSAKIDGYTVTFKVEVKEPSKAFFTDEQLKSKENRNAAAWHEASTSDNGNVYAGLDGHMSKKVEGETYVGGTTVNGKHTSMNTHDEYGDMGKYKDLVAHEFAHLFGLDDKDGDKDGKTDPYYGGDKGIMKYEGTDLNSVSDDDVKIILQYAKDVLSEKTKGEGPKVKVIEQKGKSNGANPIGVTNE